MHSDNINRYIIKINTCLYTRFSLSYNNILIEKDQLDRDVKVSLKQIIQICPRVREVYSMYLQCMYILFSKHRVRVTRCCWHVCGICLIYIR